jgi:hypothetical protein
LDLPLAFLGVHVASTNIQNNINVLENLNRLCQSNKIIHFKPIEKGVEVKEVEITWDVNVGGRGLGQPNPIIGSPKATGIGVVPTLVPNISISYSCSCCTIAIDRSIQDNIILEQKKISYITFKIETQFFLDSIPNSKKYPHL